MALFYCRKLGGDCMDQDVKRNACRGCVCLDCKLSEKQGNLYSECNRCQACKSVKLMTCSRSVLPQETNGGDIWL